MTGRRAQRPRDPQARREALAAAVIETIAEVGMGRTTHRAVAARAGLPLGATTYYFPTLDDLIVAGLRQAAEAVDADLRSWSARLAKGSRPPNTRHQEDNPVDTRPAASARNQENSQAESAHGQKSQGVEGAGYQEIRREEGGRRAASAEAQKSQDVEGAGHRESRREEGGRPATNALRQRNRSAEDGRAGESTPQTEDPQEIGDLAQTLAELVGSFLADRRRARVEYELYLAAARDPVLRPLAEAWLHGLHAVLEPHVGGPAARDVSAFLDGVMLQALVTGGEPDTGAVAATIRRLTPRRPPRARSGSRAAAG